MENKGKTNGVLLEKSWYKKKILENIEEINSTWILSEILRFVENVKK